MSLTEQIDATEDLISPFASLFFGYIKRIFLNTLLEFFLEKFRFAFFFKIMNTAVHKHLSMYLANE